MQVHPEEFIGADGQPVALIGKGIDRTDGPLKVTGHATFAAEYKLPDMAYAEILQSTISKGTIAALHTQEAEHAPGVLAVLSYKNVEKFNPAAQGSQAFSPSPGMNLMLRDNRIVFYGQDIAVVVADTLDEAQYAASLIRVEYKEEPFAIHLPDHFHEARVPKEKVLDEHDAEKVRGQPHEALKNAEVISDEVYITPTENHNPMEMHATVASWKGDRLTLYDSTQYISGVQGTIAQVLRIPADHIQVICKFTGGGFGCKGATWPHVALAAMAAKFVGRPVRIELTRPQMFTSVGRRSETIQRIALGADRQGHLESIIHECVNQQAVYDHFIEGCTMPTRMLYVCPHVHVKQSVVSLNTITPTYMRAPGEAPGMLALETAMDELSYKLNMDPLELRLRNYAEKDPGNGMPWSSKSLRQCYAVAGEHFGWKHRNPAVGSMHDPKYPGEKIGWGMATATYPANYFPGSASVAILANGHAVVESGTQDLGTGTYTIMCQVAAEALGVPEAHVQSRLGNTKYPQAGVSGGSSTAASVCSSIREAAIKLRQKLGHMASEDHHSPLHGADPAHIETKNGFMYVKGNASRGETYAQLLKRHNQKEVSAEAHANQPGSSNRYSKHGFGAVFAAVRVRPDIGQVRVERIVAAYGAGRILNAKTAHSQFMGGIVWGVSMALFEHVVADRRTGKIVNNNFADYLVPVNADIPAVEIHMIPENDPHVNVVGVKGIGEIGIVGSGAAVGNAVYHATGKRIREFPITTDKLL